MFVQVCATLQTMQKIFITGATSGIGEALAREYAQTYSKNDMPRDRISIGLAGRRSEHLHRIAEQLQQNPHVTCATYALDVRDAPALQQAADNYIQRFGVPDIVIANAGVSRGTLTEEKDDIPAFQAVFDTNVMGMVHTFAAFIPAMKNAKRGQLVGIASVAGIRGLPGSGAYSASKSAAITYLESLRSEMQHHNIIVTCIAPGYVRTPMTDINTYKMPFIIDADEFASKFVQAVKSKRRFLVIPWQMGIVAKLMRSIPPFLWDRLSRNAPHKPRTLRD